MRSSFANSAALAGCALAALAAFTAPMAQATDDAASVQHRAAGRQLFDDWGCATCHTLADAGAVGHVGPAFDGDTALTKDFIVNRVTNGQGPMPAFGGLMTDEEIGTLADYIVAAKAS